MFFWNFSDEIADFYCGKIILITGGSMGIGEGFVEHLSRCSKTRMPKVKTKIVICARSEGELNKVSEKYTNPYCQVYPLTCDVTDYELCKFVVVKSVKEFGGIDVVILNAGISGSQAFSDTTDLSIYRKMLDVNFMGYVNFTHLCLPELKTRKDARIGVMCSMSGRLGIPLRTAYCASKFAVSGFFQVLRNELIQEGADVKITLLCPGWVDTSIRFRHIVESQRSYEKKKMMSVEDCVQQSLLAIAKGDREERFGGIQSWSPLLIEIFPNFIEGMVRSKVYGSSQSNM